MCVVYNETWLFVLESLTGRSSSSLYWTNFKVSDVVYDNNWTPQDSEYSWLYEKAIVSGNDVSKKEFLRTAFARILLENWIETFKPYNLQRDDE